MRKTIMHNLSRRQWLQAGLGACAGLALGAKSSTTSELAARRAAEAHAEIWRRFIDKHGVMLDFAAPDGSVEIPTPEECRLGKPNALGWWSPIENGGFFNGLYMDAAVNRWRVTKNADDAAKARRLAGGLMLLASVSPVKGFVARGVATDGRSHYPMGSDDQTLPWFFGLWTYLDSGIPTADERGPIEAKIVETGEEVLRRGWAMPAEAPFGVRGGFSSFLFYQAPRLLFVAKLMHRLTAQPRWEQIYRRALGERGGPENLSRLELCRRGMVYDHGPRRHSWTTSNCVAAMRALWELETDADVRRALAEGLELSSQRAMESLPDAIKWDNDNALAFDPDWRKLNALWAPQHTPREAEEVARPQSRELGRSSPRRAQEFSLVREPAFASWIVTLTPDVGALKLRTPDVERVIAHYRYDRLWYSQFFPVECAWWRISAASSGKSQSKSRA